MKALRCALPVSCEEIHYTTDLFLLGFFFLFSSLFFSPAERAGTVSTGDCRAAQTAAGSHGYSGDAKQRVAGHAEESGDTDQPVHCRQT